jgi:phospho-N-acetylmuramoyl-pentapeptide-transferase
MSKFSIYPTFVVFVAMVLAAALTMVLTLLFIRLLKRRHIGQQVRADGPQSHLVKQGTPTMGGIMMLIGATVAMLIVCKVSPTLIALIVATLLTGALGLVDDAAKVINKRSLGLTPKAKLIGQFAIAVVFILVAVNVLGVPPTVDIPFICVLDLGIWTTSLDIGGFHIIIPWLYLIIISILIAGMTNATNLTDGLDGLAAGTVMIVMLVMAAIAYRSDMLDASVFAAALAGSCIGFLWFNSYPADIFMGDTGSEALGCALACLAVVTKTEFVVLIIGMLFIAEAVSVIIQVLHYKRTKKRVFLMAPLHHHFERKGWSEVKVVIRFWIVSAAFAAIGFCLYFAESLLTVA